MPKIKRSEFMTFIDVDPSNESYYLLGEGVTAGKVSYNPKTTEEQYIHEDNARTSIDSYSPNMPVEQIGNNTDEIFEYLDALRIARAILEDAETTIVNVWAYESGGPTAYPAEQQAVAIQIDDFGGDAGKAVATNFTINYIGDPIPGTFNATTKVFTAS